jgi:hypothetical protein
MPKNAMNRSSGEWLSLGNIVDMPEFSQCLTMALVFRLRHVLQLPCDSRMIRTHGAMAFLSSGFYSLPPRNLLKNDFRAFAGSISRKRFRV